MTDELMDYAFLYAEKAGLMKETVLARPKMALQDMMKRTNNEASNISILMAEYRDLSKQVLNKPPSAY